MFAESVQTIPKRKIRCCLGEDVWEFKSRQCDVLYISLEDPERRIQSRVAEITRGESGNLWFATETELMGRGFEEQISGFLFEHPSVKFIIVDGGAYLSTAGVVRKIDEVEKVVVMKGQVVIPIELIFDIESRAK